MNTFLKIFFGKLTYFIYFPLLMYSRNIRINHLNQKKKKKNKKKLPIKFYNKNKKNKNKKNKI